MTIDKLYNQIYNDESTKNSDTFIDIFETHKDLIVGSNVSQNTEIHNQVMRLTADYAHNLTTRENYKKAQPQIDLAIGLFESYPEFKTTDLFTLEFYESLIFDRAVVNYNLKQYKDSLNDLKSLNKRFPNNDKYKNWIAAAKTYSMQTFISILWCVIAGIVLATSLFDEQDIGDFYDYLLYGGAVILLITIVAEIIKRIRQKSIKRG
jgi:tetratricopeptide (TPR) repeat protein